MDRYAWVIHMSCRAVFINLHSLAVLRSSGTARVGLVVACQHNQSFLNVIVLSGTEVTTEDKIPWCRDKVRHAGDRWLMYWSSPNLSYRLSPITHSVNLSKPHSDVFSSDQLYVICTASYCMIDQSRWDNYLFFKIDVDYTTGRVVPIILACTTSIGLLILPSVDVGFTHQLSQHHFLKVTHLCPTHELTQHQIHQVLPAGSQPSTNPALPSANLGPHPSSYSFIHPLK